LPAKLVEADPGAASFEKAPPKLVGAVTTTCGTRSPRSCRACASGCPVLGAGSRGAAFSGFAQSISVRSRQATREEMMAQARNTGIRGASRMSESELTSALS
jgi:hypothetical protein